MRLEDSWIVQSFHPVKMKQNAEKKRFIIEKKQKKIFKRKTIDNFGKILHLFSSKTPTSWAELSREGVNFCAFSM